MKWSELSENNEELERLLVSSRSDPAAKKKLLIGLLSCSLLLPFPILFAALLALSVSGKTEVHIWATCIAIGVVGVMIVLRFTWWNQKLLLSKILMAIVYAIATAIGTLIVAVFLWIVVAGGYVPGK